MKLPISWLNEYVRVDDIEPRDLAEKLTRAGLQVESIETVGGSPLSDLIVVAEVLECAAHPDSDHLHVCKVTDGKETFQVVCGAPNMRQGIKTAFAKIGAPIPGFLDRNGKPEKIKKGKLRGVESFGMCCSEKELCIGEGNDGIIEYPAETPNGTPVRDLAGQEKPETVFDIEVTWNRPDALSVVGLAREFGAILGREVKLPAVDFTECETKAADEVKVVVEDPVKCPRYTARVVTEVTDGPSPEFMRRRLELCGVRSLGLIVDVTNYVLMELGAPMHAFDHTRLKDRTIVVRTARDGETIKTLDGVDRKLDPTMLVICDAERPNAVAGVMGGAESEIAAGTRTVLLESALFEPTSIKFTATKLGLGSESSYRYIRGVDKNIADFASRRAAHLLQQHGGAKIAAGVVDVDNRVKAIPDEAPTYAYNAPVTLDFERARRAIGIPIGNDVMVYILSRLGLKLEGPARDHFAAEPSVTFRIPSWRWDLSLEADLIEEIARIYGLDNIPDTMPSAPSVSSLGDRPFRARSRVRELCRALGFTEAMHYSFLSAKELAAFDARPETQASRLAIPDPVSAEFAVMRDSLLPQMIESVGRNAAHRPGGVMLFEAGKVFAKVTIPAKGDCPAKERPVEKEMLALAFAGPVGREALRQRANVSEEEAVLWLKGAIGELLAKLHAGQVEFAPTVHPAFARGAVLEVKLNARRIGLVGALSAKMRHPYRLTSQMAVAELELKPLLKNFDTVGRVSAVAPYPSIGRDIAIVAAGEITHAAVAEVIRRNGGRELVDIRLFDIFKSKELGGDRRSLAYALEFRSDERTLTDEEVGRSFQRIVEALKATPGIDVREG